MRHMVNINRQIMLEGMRADFHKVDRLSSKVHRHRPQRAATIRATTHGRQRLHARRSIRTTVAEDERPDQPRQVGQPARRRSVHHARRTSTARFVIDGVVGDFLCEQFGSLAGRAADAPRQGQPPRRGAQRQQGAARRLLELHAHRRELAIASASSPSAPTSSSRTSSATSCRTRSSRASTSPSAIPTARTPAPTGIRRRTSTSSATRFDIWVDDRQIMRTDAS